MLFIYSLSFNSEAAKGEGSNEKDYQTNIRHCFKVHKARHFRKLSYNRKMEKN